MKHDHHHATRLAPRTGDLPPDPTLADLCAPLSAKVMPPSAKYTSGGSEARQASQLSAQRKQGSRSPKWKRKAKGQAND